MEKDKIAIVLGAAVLLGLGGVIAWRSQSMLDEAPEVVPVKLPGGLPPAPKVVPSISTDDEPPEFDRDAARNKSTGPQKLPFAYRGQVSDTAIIEDLESTLQGRYQVGDAIRDATVSEITKDLVRLTRGAETFVLALGDETFGRSQLTVKGKTAVYPWSISPDNRTLVERLTKHRCDLNAESVTLAEFARIVSQWANAEVTLSPALVNSEARLTFSVRDLPVAQALNLVLGMWNFDYVLRDGKIILTTKSDAEKDPFTKSLSVAQDLERVKDGINAPPPQAIPQDPMDIRVEQSLKLTRMDANFTDMPIEEVIDFMRTLSSQNILLAEPPGGVQRKEIPKVTMNLTNVTLEEVIKAAGLVPTVKDGIIVLRTKEEAALEQIKIAQKEAAVLEARKEADRTRATALGRSFTAKFDSTPLYLAAQEIGKKARLQVIVQEDLWGETPRVTLAGEMSVESALSSIASSTGTRWVVEGGTLYFVR